MTNLILLGLFFATGGFLLFCLFHFRQELKKISELESHAGVWVALPKLRVVPIAVWRERIWDVTFKIDNSKSRSVKGERAGGRDSDKAA